MPRRGRGRGDALDDYRAKRDFAATSEPAGEDAQSEATTSPRFVIQQHDATRLHWDLRLERDGTLASWALPRGLPLDPGDDRVAVRTEDHPLQYLDFHGEIPSGSYGAGTMTIFDRGTCAVHEFTTRKVEFTLSGERNEGRYGMFPIGRSGDEWLIHRMQPPQDPDRERLPEQLLPMLAKAGELPPRAQQERWGHEVKWDGIRALLWCDHGQVRIESRTQREITERYPEVKPIGRALAAAGLLEVLLDGELVALDEQGKPSFERLQGRMNAGSEAAIRRAARGAPVTYVIFDLLHRDGRSLLATAYEERRAQLDQLGIGGPAWRVPAYHRGNGSALLAATREQGLEGIVAKRLDAHYEPGRRGGAWLKLRNRLRQELVIGGWLPGEGNREGRIGALLVGDRDQPGGPLRYAGRVGSGLSEAQLDDLHEQLTRIARRTRPFAPAPRGARSASVAIPRTARWVEPLLVAEVEYTERTREGVLRQPVFKGLRDDKPPQQVVRERADLRGQRLSNWDKVLYPSTGFTKGDLIDYYVAIAPTLLPHVQERPVTLRRWPDGVAGRTFYEKNSPSHRPQWVETASIYSRSENRRIAYTLVQDTATLAWTANLAAIELHPSLSLARDMDHPTAVVFDLDPGPGTGLQECAEIALLLEGLFAQLGLRTAVKTSGSKGLQVYLPLGEGAATYAQTKPFAKQIAELLERRLPELVVARMTRRLRAGKVLVDWSQNDEHKTTVCVYSVRAKERPQVSAPLSWEELRAAHADGAAAELVFDPQDVLRRVAEQGDLFAPMLGSAQQLPRL
ncbi:DNA ligase D [Conexibacter sp. JD483]|uniref:DNA ligase D n=1 Tax=unclassified Conexibacter TaxID=2627773 RepID=UPI002726A274|nr:MULTISPECIES: DNA ligase D [unclassified Conexibacter]MDO8188285.1 DNA ligase D [Conexibacter sp. CPCC 205706]MDO8198965.1 DNA ligase D [Conexibacter sp. CPCC 205762]MDR9371001.1 DNA ligase D [Conexibacter sp. JD483]